MDNFFELPSEVMTALATIIGFASLGDLTGGQQNVLGNFLMLIAQVICTNGTQKQYIDNTMVKSRVALLEEEIKLLKELLKVEDGSL